MGNKLLSLLFVLCSWAPVRLCAQETRSFADSIRIHYHVPELSYAVVSADSIYELHALGVRKINTQLAARLSDRFRIGSNTKAITGFIAATLVKQGKLSWDTQFFDLFPEWKAASRKEYRNLTLLNLLSFRTKLIPYTYTDAKPVKGQFQGDEGEQRYQFAQWFFQQPPVRKRDSICFSNLGYVAAGLMLEKASGKTYQQLVTDLGIELGIDFGLGQPNNTDTLQTWGHGATLTPEPPRDAYKLNWLQAAGNINASLPGYLKFVQLQLRGLNGKSTMLDPKEFRFLHYGLGGFSVGWFWETDAQHRPYSYNTGNPGTFLTAVYVFPSQNKALVVFMNAQTDEAEEGVEVMIEVLKGRYGLVDK